MTAADSAYLAQLGFDDADSPADTSGKPSKSSGSAKSSKTATMKPTARNYFIAFLSGLGLPVTEDNLEALYGVADLEGWNDRFNPLNVVQPEPGSVPFNSAGVQAYDSFSTGVQGAVTLFRGSHWAGVRQALAAGNSEDQVLAAFKAAYTWDPNVQFPQGQPAWGNKLIGPGGSIPVAGNLGGDIISAIGDSGNTINGIADATGVPELIGAFSGVMKEVANLLIKALFVTLGLVTVALGAYATAKQTSGQRAPEIVEAAGAAG